MSKPLVITLAAADEVAEVNAWYETHAPQVAPRFVKELRAVFDAIRERPDSFPKLGRIDSGY